MNKILRMSLMMLTLGLFLISCGNGKKEEQKMKVQSYDRQEEPSKDVEHLQDDKGTMNEEVMDKAEEASMESDAETPKNKKGKISADQEDVVELYLTGNDKMKYNKKELKVEAGSTVKLVFEHVGKMSVQTMGHNFVLLKKGVDKMAFGQEASSYASDGYIPSNTDKVIAHTKMIGGGKKTMITFEAPLKGTYDYICSFPGHVALMNGKFIVE
jgi:azurin